MVPYSSSNSVIEQVIDVDIIGSRAWLRFVAIAAISLAEQTTPNNSLTAHKLLKLSLTLLMTH